MVFCGSCRRRPRCWRGRQKSSAVAPEFNSICPNSSPVDSPSNQLEGDAAHPVYGSRDLRTILNNSATSSVSFTESNRLVDTEGYATDQSSVPGAESLVSRDLLDKAPEVTGQEENLSGTSASLQQRPSQSPTYQDGRNLKTEKGGDKLSTSPAERAAEKAKHDSESGEADQERVMSGNYPATPTTAASSVPPSTAAVGAARLDPSSLSSSLSSINNNSNNNNNNNNSNSNSNNSSSSNNNNFNPSPMPAPSPAPKAPLHRSSSSASNGAPSPEEPLELKLAQQRLSPGNYLVHFTRVGPQQRWGFVWDAQALEKRQVRILDKLSPKTISDAWAKDHPTVLRPGDELVRVNGIGDRLEKMTVALTGNLIVCEFRRANATSAPTVQASASTTGAAPAVQNLQSLGLPDPPAAALPPQGEPPEAPPAPLPPSAPIPPLAGGGDSSQAAQAAPLPPAALTSPSEGDAACAASDRLSPSGAPPPPEIDPNSQPQKVKEEPVNKNSEKPSQYSCPHFEGLLPGNFGVELSRQLTAEKWGFIWNEQALDKRSVRVVERILSETPASAWNTQWPSLEVKPGDELVSVNGEGSRLETMTVQLATKRRIICEFKPGSARSAAAAQAAPQASGAIRAVAGSSSLSPKNARPEQVPLDSPIAARKAPNVQELVEKALAKPAPAKAFSTIDSGFGFGAPASTNALASSSALSRWSQPTPSASSTTAAPAAAAGGRGGPSSPTSSQQPQLHHQLQSQRRDSRGSNRSDIGSSPANDEKDPTFIAGSNASDNESLVVEAGGNPRPLREADLDDEEIASVRGATPTSNKEGGTMEGEGFAIESPAAQQLLQQHQQQQPRMRQARPPSAHPSHRSAAHPVKKSEKKVVADDPSLKQPSATAVAASSLPPLLLSRKDGPWSLAPLGPLQSPPAAAAAASPQPPPEALGPPGAPHPPAPEPP